MNLRDLSQVFITQIESSGVVMNVWTTMAEWKPVLQTNPEWHRLYHLDLANRVPK